MLNNYIGCYSKFNTQLGFENNLCMANRYTILSVASMVAKLAPVVVAQLTPSLIF